MVTWRHLMPPEMIQGALVVGAALLAALVVVLVRQLAGMPFFGGPAKHERGTVDELYIEGKVKFEDYEDYRHSHGHAH